MSFRQLAHTCVEYFGGGKVVEITNELSPEKSSVTFDLDIKKAKEKLSWWPIIELNQGLRLVHEHKFLPLDI